MTKFYIDSDLEKMRPEICYVLQTWAKQQKTEIIFTNTRDDSITIGATGTNVIPVSGIGQPIVIKDKIDRNELLSTAYYLINSMQEYKDKDKDDFGRFKYANSYQHTLKNPTANIVQQCFNEISTIAGISPLKTKTRFFLSHDIDTVYESILQDGFHVLKKGRFDLFLGLLFRVAVGRPDWLNIDQIMNIESEYDCRSTFFWIVKKGKEGNLKNADYSFTANKIQRLVNSVKQRGFENGLHKSISSTSFETELDSFTERPVASRYHYLKFNLPHGFNTIENAGLKMDASLGFAENIGFRNSYGLPFSPYNLTTRKPYSFVEAPLHIMDTTLFKYQKSNLQDAEKDIFNFFEANRVNCVLSVLWHNNFFSNYKYKGYLELYKKILAYIKENHFSSISQKEIINEFSIA
jgi:hypothetical protein